MIEKIKQKLQDVTTVMKNTVKRLKSVLKRVSKQILKPVVIVATMVPGASFAQAIDLSTLTTKIDEQVPGLTSVGVSVTGLIIIVAIFGLAFLLLRSR